MKTKKATIYESLQGIIIFAIILVAIIVFIRKISSEDRVDEKEILLKLQEDLQELAEQEGTLKHTFELDLDSAIIGYAKNKDAILLNFEINLPELGQIPLWQGTYPQDYKTLKGAMNSVNIQGVIKQKPSTCLIDENCICYCEDIQTKTSPESQYDSENAYLTCESESCLVINQNINSEINLQEFFKDVDIKYSQLKNKDGEIANMQPQPQTDSLQWDGGFIIMRSTKNIGETCELYNGHSPRINECDNAFKTGIGKEYDSRKTMIITPTIAGYRRAFSLRYIDAEFTNDKGTITPRLI